MAIQSHPWHSGNKEAEGEIHDISCRAGREKKAGQFKPFTFETSFLTSVQNPPEHPDLFTYLQSDDPKTSEDSSTKERDLVYDTELALQAGSETTAGALAATAFLLAKHPDKFAKLQKEIDPLFKSADDFSHQAVMGKPMLEGCINEALRLFPPVPSGMPRITPPEGLKIAGRFIPGDTIVSTPTYTIHRGTCISPFSKT
jgi:cytochrome P450